MNIAYLVINNSKNGLYPFNEQFQIFSDREEAIQHFFEIGGERDPWGIDLSTKVGVASIQRGGLIDVMFMPVEVQ